MMSVYKAQKGHIDLSMEGWPVEQWIDMSCSLWKDKDGYIHMAELKAGAADPHARLPQLAIEDLAKTGWKRIAFEWNAPFKEGERTRAFERVVFRFCNFVVRVI